MLNKEKVFGKQIVSIQWIEEITTLDTTKDERTGENLICDYLLWFFDVDESNPLN